MAAGLHPARRWRAAALLLAAASPLALAGSPEPAALTVPFPNFVTQPSAAVLYCTARLQTGLGVDTARHPLQLYGTASASSDDPQPIRLTMGATSLRVAIGFRDGGKVQFPAEFPYRILSDEPREYYAVRDPVPGLGLQSVVLNRELGEMVFTLTIGSLSPHPSQISTYYTCSPDPVR